MKKAKIIISYIIPFVLMSLFAFLPLFKTYNMITLKDDDTIFGFHFIIGKMIKNEGISLSKISSSWQVILVFILIPITIFILNRFIKNSLAKKTVNAIFILAIALYFYFFQFYNYKFLGSYFYNILGFKTTIFYTLLCIIYILYALYYLIVLGVSIKRYNNKNKQYLTTNEIKENNDL